MSEEQVSSENTESTSSSEPASQAGTQSEDSSQAVASKEAERQVPFHEHPRFKELIEQKNQSAREAEELKRNYQTLVERLNTFETKQQPSSPQEDKMISRLKGIDPEFADYLAALKNKTEEFQSTQAELANLRQERLREQATSKMNELYSTNKVPDNRKAFYDHAVKSKVYEIEAVGKRLSVNDLDSIFKSVHDEHSKFFDSYDRELTSKYVVDKKKDAAAPTTQTGGAAAAIPQGEGPKTADDVKSLLAKQIRQLNQKI